jgi:hypothetical protein
MRPDEKLTCWSFEFPEISERVLQIQRLPLARNEPSKSHMSVRVAPLERVRPFLQVPPSQGACTGGKTPQELPT